MTEIGCEIELKFLCEPKDLPVVLAAAPSGDEECRELISVYFDTPDGALQKAGASLRVRESGGKRVQTVKRGEGFCREEYEQPIIGDAPNPDLGPLPELLPPACRQALKPAFNVRVTRRQRLIRYGGAEIELAVDQGEVQGGRRVSPICEVELELKSGPPRALFDLARELARAAPLYLSFDSKAAQGQALVAGAPPEARRKEKVTVSPDANAAEAFQAVARNALSQLAGNAEVLREAPQAEAVHQLRVGARRLRSALSTFSGLVRDARHDVIKAELRWVGEFTNPARNLDVFADETVEPARALDPPPPGLERLIAELAELRERAHQSAAQAVRAERFRMLLIDAVEWVETGDWLSDPDRRTARETPARTFAAQALERHRRKLFKRGRNFTRSDDAARHKTRIEAKKLRYAAEAFACLFPEKPTARFLKQLKRLQDELGQLNDIVTAEPTISQLRLEPEAAFAAGELVGRKVVEKPRLIAKTAKALDRLKAAPRFWPH